MVGEEGSLFWGRGGKWQKKHWGNTCATSDSFIRLSIPYGWSLVSYALATRISEFRFFNFSALFWKVFRRILGNIMQLFGRYFEEFEDIFWKFGFCHFLGRYFALGRLSAFSWQIFGTYLERKKKLADFRNLVFVSLLKFETNFGGKLDENQPKKCRKVEKSEFGFMCSQCIIVGKILFMLLRWLHIL